jgi:hypothetical protein
MRKLPALHHVGGTKNRSGCGNKKIGRQQGREDKRGQGAGGGHTKSAKNHSLRDMKGGRWGMRSTALFQKGPGRRKILLTQL